MREIKEHVDTRSDDYKEGLAAGLNSAEDTKNWPAGNELGREPNEAENQKPVSEILFKEPSLPLFLSDSSEGKKGNLQDEKDETEE